MKKTMALMMAAAMTMAIMAWAQDAAKQNDSKKTACNAKTEMKANCGMANMKKAAGDCKMTAEKCAEQKAAGNCKMTAEKCAEQKAAGNCKMTAEKCAEPKTNAPKAGAAAPEPAKTK